MRGLGLSLVVTIIFSVNSLVNGNDPVTVVTNYGSVLGYQTEQARFFYGIPFAKPPVADLRWKSPVPIPKWGPNVVNATVPAPACPQPKCHLPSILCPKIFSEDCLYLNVFTPRTLSSSPLPVMIFITGGNFQFLDASIPVYYPERFVNTTNVILAFIQYRLGALGFLATGTGPDDFKGNFGIEDQRLSIIWLKENIQAFGGDPDQITIFGQSAGGQSTALHYVTADMQPYFRAAIVESAPTSLPFRTYDEYITPGVLLGEQLGCEYKDWSCYRRATYEQIVAAQTVVNTLFTSFEFLVFFEPWVPVIDNSIVFGQVIDTIHNVSFPLKPLMIGTVTEDALFFIYMGWQKPVNAEQFVEAAVVSFGVDALKVIERYPPISPGDQRPLLTKIATPWVFFCSNRIISRKANPYTYVFGYPLDFDGWENSTFCNGHVCHGGDLPYLFESYWNNFTDAGRQLSASMATYWSNFGKSMNPNSPVTLPVVWPKMSAGYEPYIYLQSPIEIRNNYLGDDCDFFDKIGYKHNSMFRF